MFNLGLNKRKKGAQKYEEAIKYFKEAIEVNKQQFIARRYIADSYFELKKFKDAIEFYKEIRQNERVIKCFDILLKENGNSVELVREKSRFY